MPAMLIEVSTLAVSQLIIWRAAEAAFKNKNEFITCIMVQFNHTKATSHCLMLAENIFD